MAIQGRYVWRVAALMSVLLAAAPGLQIRGQPPTPRIELITSTPAGAAGGGQQFFDVIPYDRGPSHISADNRLVVFASASSALVAGDTNGVQDVFVRDRATGVTTLVSRSSGGGPANGHSGTPVISANGRYVAFVSVATNLVASDTNGAPDVFVRDLVAGVTSIVSVSSAGVAADLGAYAPSISADGRDIAFASASASLVDDDTNVRNSDIFVRDTVTDTTERVSLRADGSQIVRASSTSPSISADGRRVAFAVSDDPSNGPPPASAGPNLHHGVYVRDRDTAATILVSATPAGTPSELHYAIDPAISADGRFVSFSSLDDLDPAAPDTTLEPDGPYSDIFVRDLETSTTERVSVPFSGGPVEESGVLSTISGDGRYVTYATTDSSSIRIRDRQTHVTTVIRGLGDAVPDGSFDSASISLDGQLVYFESTSTNLVAGDTNGLVDGFAFQMAPTADLSLSLSASTITPAPDSDVTLTLAVANAGPSDASAVAVRAALPAGLTFVSATGTYASATGIWTVGALTSGSTASMQIVGHFTSTEAVSIAAEISAASPSDPDSTPNNGNPAEDDQHTEHITPSASVGIIVNDASMTVSRTDGRCTLVEAIVAANTDLPSGDAVGECAGGNGADTIFLRATTPPYVVSSINNRSDGPNGLPVIVSDITIEAGGGAISRATAPGTPDFRIFDVAPIVGRLTLNHAHIVNGRLATNVPGTFESSGAGILSQGLLTLNDTEVANGLAACLGGGIAATGPTILRSAMVRGNTAGCSGGGIYTFEAGGLTIADSTIAQNAAPSGSGGGLMIHGTTTAVIARTVFDANSARFDGGAVLAHNPDANLTMTDSTIVNNVVTAGHGGGIANGRLDTLGIPSVFGGTMTLTNVSVRGNRASGGFGGGIANAGTLVATGGTISDNQVLSVGCGGAVHNARQVTLTGIELASNRSVSSGGGVCSMNGGTLVVNDATITGNVTDGPGGAVALFGSQARITNSRLVGNRAGSSGGGVSSQNFLSGLTVEIATTLVRGNNAGSVGGGVAISGGSMSIVRSTIAVNTATFGAGIDVTGETSVADISTSTLSGNVSSSGSGGVNIASGGPTAIARATIASTTIVDNVGNPGGVVNGGALQLTESILIGNHRADGVFAECAKAVTFATSSVLRNLIGQDASCYLVSEDVPAAATRFVNPSLVFSSVVAPLADNGGPTPTHALVAGSLAIDGGSDGPACLPTDQRGLPRPIDGDRDGVTRCDLGAIEQQTPMPGPQAIIGSLVPSVAAAGSGPTVVTVFGSGFTASTVASFNGSPRGTFVFGPTQLRVTLLASDLLPAGDIATGLITARTPGTLESNARLFTIRSARVAAIDSIVVPTGTEASVSLAPTIAGRSGVAATFTNSGVGGGAAILSVATYGSSPIAGTAFAAGGFFDVQVTGADALDSVAARFYYPTGLSIAGELTLQLQYWTGSAWAPVVGAGGATPDKNTTDNLDGTVSGGRFSVTLDGTSTPRITQLGGTVFALMSAQRDTTPPTTTAIQSPSANANGWNRDTVTMMLTAADNGSGIAATELELDGSRWKVYEAPIRIDREGVHIVRYRSRDVAGNIEDVRTAIVRIDKSVPLFFVQAIPSVLRHADDRLIDVNVWTLLFDCLSGGDGFALISITSNDPATTPDDMRGWTIGTADTRGQLRGEGTGGRARVYTLTYEGRDRAGNTVRVSTSVRVAAPPRPRPH